MKDVINKLLVREKDKLFKRSKLPSPCQRFMQYMFFDQRPCRPHIPLNLDFKVRHTGL